MIIQIFVNGIELHHVREDGKFKEENNSFSDNLKVTHTTRPLRIIEDRNAIEALGAFSVTAAGKRRYFPCKVVMGGIHYNGILTQLEKIRGFRKCDVKFGSALNEIMDKKIATFFPSYSVVPNAPEYSEESPEPHNAGAAWQNIAQQRIGKVYPEVKWALPQMSWRGKFGEDLKQQDTHYRYLGSINYYMMNKLVVNQPATEEGFDQVPYNANVIAPQVFILSPLHYAFESLGYILTGNFVKDPFFRSLMLLSFNDNMTKVVQKYPGTVIDINSPVWEDVLAWNILGFRTPSFAKRVFLTAEEGDYILRYRVEKKWVPGQIMAPAYGVELYLDGEPVDIWKTSGYGTNEGSFSLQIGEDQVGQEIEIRYHSFDRTMPDDYHLEFAEDLPDLEFYDQHPTIDFSRYLPDWTVAAYLENLAKTWNLKIDFDDIAKEVRIDFNEEDYLLKGEIYPIRKSLELSSFKNIPSESYLLKYANDRDPAVFVSQEEVGWGIEKNENTTVLESPFKYIPHSSTTAQLSEAVEDKEGVGLILAAVGSQYTSETFQGRSLSYMGEGGIYETHWKRWLAFRLNASSGILKGPFTQTELFMISSLKKIYVDNQVWLVKSLEYKENDLALLETSLEVESVTY